MQLKDLLTLPDFKFRRYRSDGRFPEFEELFSIGFIGAYMFDELKRDLGRVPTQDEFVEEGKERAIKFFEKNPQQFLYKSQHDFYFAMNDRLINAIENRVARSYASFILEEQVSEYLEKQYDVKLVKNTHVDVLFGSDVTIVDNDDIYYIHITKDNEWSHKLISSKGNSSPYIFHKGKKRYWKRNWKKGHHILTYDNPEHHKMNVINGNVLFRESYLNEYFDDLLLFSSNYDNKSVSELKEFYTFLCQHELLGGVK